MEVLSPSKKHTQALEMVSEEEEEEAALESEHEEGEICSEEEDDDEVLVDEGEGLTCPVFQSSNYDNSLTSYPTHFSSFQERRTSKKPPSAAVASEVVIYDDSGRTAIFTSPKKLRISSYPRRSEGSRQHTREGPRRKEKEVDRTRRHHSSAAAVPEKWPKATRRSITESKGSGASEEIHLHPHKGKEARSGHRVRRSRQSSPDSTSGSSSSSSCSCSSSTSSISCSLSEEESDIASVSLRKGRGKENRRCGPSSKGHDRSPPPREYGCERPPPKVPSKPPPGRRSSKHGGSQHRVPSPHSRETWRRPSYHHNIRRTSKEREVGKASHHHHHHQQHRTHQKPSKAKPSERKETTKPEKPAKEVESVSNTAKSQNWLPRGSLGEMLLSRPKASSTHPTPSTQAIPQVPEENPKASVKTKKEEKVEEEVPSKPPLPAEVRELSTLDQEDDEELQLRLIAIQSSLRLLTDMQKEGQQLEGAEGTLGSILPTNKAVGEAAGSQDSLEELRLPTECLMGRQKDMADPGSYTPPLGASQEMPEIVRTLLGDTITIQSTDDIISISSSSASEICIENLATNKSYLEAAVKEGDGEGEESKVTDEIKRKLKERPDVDPNPVDMEICNSSGEDEDGPSMVVVQDSPLSPDPGQDTGQSSGDPTTKGEGVTRVGDSLGGGGNFQIPVEWAYMVPPPPPPDQPANDIQNISSWCFDQNMYLQSMQAAPTEEQQQQQQQHSQSDPGSAEWLLPQPHTAPWPTSFMESYDNTLPPGISDNTAASVPMGIPPEQHKYPPPEPPQSQEASPEQSKDLKDVPAEQYQAFMSAVLQQQSPTPKGGTTFTECPQRNLILVPLSDSHHSESATAAATKTTNKMKAKKLRAKKRRLKKQRTQENLQQIPNGNSGIVAAATANPSVEEVEEEDEDLLRAQLLIDMSRKKEQRVLESQNLPLITAAVLSPTTTAATTAVLPVPPPAPFPAPLQTLVNRAVAVGREGYEGRASPQSLLQSSDALLPAPRNFRMVKGFGTRPGSGENSPTHTFRADMRSGLSDISGWRLDPKGSKFNYHSTQHDFPHGSSDGPKPKFPPIEPVIISLESDSEDSEEEEDASREASSVDSGKKEVEVESMASEPISQSIDILLKSMRNANTTTKEPEPVPPKPGPSTPSIPPTRPRKVADTTPQAVVRHLSRDKQEEYRRLKEQIRKKEMLQRKKMQQRPPRTKLPQPPLPPPLSQSPLNPDSAHSIGQGSASPSFTEDSTLSMSPSKETPGEAGSEGTASSTRAVTWKDMGLLQIQVSNETALDASNESEDSSYRGRQIRAMEGDSSVDASATEDEDEETLRMMALLTQKKKKTENDTSDNQHRSVVIESKAVEKATHPEGRENEDVLADTRNEDHADEGMKEEWMVLDEVKEEGFEAGEEELCARPELSGNETEECGEGVETSDSTESVCRSPERVTHEESPEGKQQDSTKESENKESKSRESDAVTNNTAQDTDKATPVEPTSEGGSCSIPDEEMEEEPPSKTDTKQTAKVTPDGEKIEEVIRRIESKTKGVCDKAGNECLPLESNKSNVSTQGNAGQSLSTATSTWITKQQQGTEPSGKAGRRIKADQEVAEGKQPGESQSSHSEEANTHTLVKPSTTTSTTSAFPDNLNKGAGGSQSKVVTKITVEKQKEGKIMSQRTVISPDTSYLMMRKVKVVKPAGVDLQEKAEKEAFATVTAGAATITAGTATVPQEAEKSPRTQLQLKRLEKEYKEKKNGINKMIMQLGVLLHEVNEEHEQRQTLKKSVGELRLKLKEMETQLENKSNTVQTKMELIRQFQEQLRIERQALNLLEHQGERLGRRVHGNGYSLPKALPSSPNSKTKDVYMKKALADSIHALRQQVNDLTNKRKSNIGSGATNSPPAGVESRVVRTLNSETKKKSVTRNEKALPQVPPLNSILVGSSQVASRTVSQGKVLSDTLGKTQRKDGTVVVQGKSSPVKRKLVASDLGGAKVTKTEVPVESPAIQERGVTGVPTGSSNPKADDTEVGEKLDEMKALCPHDLLGRCNDTACQYQHLPSARSSLQATAKGSSQGTELPVATTTMQGWTGKRGGASGGKTGAKGKIVPGGGGRGGCSVAGRTVLERLTADFAKIVPPEPHSQTAVQEQLTKTTTLGPNKLITSTAPVVETCTTQQQTETPVASQPNTSITHQQTDTLTNTEPETSTAHQQIETHYTIEPVTLITQDHTATPNTIDPQQTEMHEPLTETDSKNSSETSTTEITETDSKKSGKASTTEITQTNRIGTESQTEKNLDEVPTTEPQETEMPETQTEASAVEPALQNEIATGGTTSSEPQTQTPITKLQETVLTGQQIEKSTQLDTHTSTREPQTAPDNVETQALLDGTELNLKEVREDRLSSSINTKMEDDLSTSVLESLSSSSSSCQPSRRRSKKTGSRPIRCRALSKGGAEKLLQDPASGQEGQDTEESVTDHQKARVTRKSLRVQAKASPKSNSSLNSNATRSPRKASKRKSVGEETTTHSPSSKRRYPTRP